MKTFLNAFAKAYNYKGVFVPKLSSKPSKLNAIRIYNYEVWYINGTESKCISSITKPINITALEEKECILELEEELIMEILKKGNEII